MTSARFDGCAVLTAIARHPASFPALKTEIDATARRLLLKQLRAASLDLKLLQQILSSVGEPSLRLGLDEMTAKDLSSLTRRLDPANGRLSGMSEAEIGAHICALGRGDVGPMPGSRVSVRAPSPKPKRGLSKIGRVLHSKVHSGLPPETAAADAKASRARRPKPAE